MNEYLQTSESIINLLVELLKRSVDELYLWDKYLIDRKMELSCSAKIFYYMQTLTLSKFEYFRFKNYNIDLEFGKNLNMKKSTQNRKNGIRPDLIIHIRGTDDNLMVVEFKMSNRSLESDKSKLRELTSLNQQYRYRLGILAIIDISGPKYFYFVGGEDYEQIEGSC